MNNRALNKKHEEITQFHEKLGHHLYCLQMADVVRYPENYADAAESAVRLAEKLTRELRSIVPVLKLKSRLECDVDSAANLGITITHSPDVVTVVLPGIMPSRSAMYKTDFLSAPLEAKLFEYDRMYQLPKFRYGEVIFTHIYNKAMSVRRIQDYDNMETKKILDCIGRHTLPDDNGLYCQVTRKLILGDEDKTIIMVKRADELSPFFVPMG